MCVKFPPGDLNPDFCPLPPTPHKHLYLWSDHRTKGAQLYGISAFIYTNNGSA